MGHCTSLRSAGTAAAAGEVSATQAPSGKGGWDVNILFFIGFFLISPLPAPILPFLHHDSLGPRWNIWPSHFWFHLLADNLFADQQGKVTHLLEVYWLTLW